MKTEKRTPGSLVQRVASSGGATSCEPATSLRPADSMPLRTRATQGLPRARFVLWGAALLLFGGLVQSTFGQGLPSRETGLVPDSAPAAFRLLAVTGPNGRNPFSLVELQTQPTAEVLIGQSWSMVNIGLDWAPNCRLYGLGAALREIDPDTGSSQILLTKIYGVPSGGTILRSDIAFHPNGTLYLMTLRQVSSTYFQNEFYTLDMTTGVAKEVCRTPGVFQCIDFSPTGVLYGEGVALCIIDLVRGIFIPVGDTVHETRLIFGMDWAPDGFVYGVDLQRRLLCQIDPATGRIVQEYGPYASELVNVATRPNATEILSPGSGFEVPGLAGAAGSEIFNQIDVPAGRTKLDITTFGGTGDVDLYVKKGSRPTAADYGWRSYHGGNDESVSIDIPQAATYHILLKGYKAYSGVTLKATYVP